MPRGQEQGQRGGCQLCSTGDVRLPLLRRSSQLLVLPLQQQLVLQRQPCTALHASPHACLLRHRQLLGLLGGLQPPIAPLHVVGQGSLGP